ncbi:Energy-coupling factor transporter transmembrane protein EcfT [Candidatus Fervidibacteria bacterium JGI MDM2 JNZ-1-D12]
MLDLFQPTQGWFAKIDGRTKLLMFLAYVLTVLSTKPHMHSTWLVLAILLAAMIFAARVPLKWVLIRFVPVLPFVGLGAVGLLLGGSKETFVQVTVKMFLCVGAAIWLSATTPFTQLLDSLRKLKVPSLLTIMLSFMFRYLFVIAEEAMRMSRAYQSRCPRKQTLKDAENVGKLAGALMLRTYPADKFFSARYKTAPYIEPIFVSVGQEPDPPKFLGGHDSGVPDSFGRARARPSDMLNFRLGSSPTLRILLFGSAGTEPSEGWQSHHSGIEGSATG